MLPPETNFDKTPKKPIMKTLGRDEIHSDSDSDLGNSIVNQ